MDRFRETNRIAPRDFKPTNLILRSAVLHGASRRMAASPCRAAILRDARKNALLRMRFMVDVEMIQTSKTMN